jgi:5S rRNA maturation endonuclease (ribonuclease M5)
MNIAFIYKNQQDLMTYQEVNKGNKGYFQSGVSTNGVLFMSDTESPSKIVIGESPIDVLSYAELKGIDNETLYIASGGFMNNLQLKHIEEIIEKNDIKKVSLATDMDLQGEIYRHQIAKLLINKEIHKIQNTIDVGQATPSQMNRLTVFQEIENSLSEATPYLSKVKSIEKYNGMFSNDDELKLLRTEGLSKINEHAFKKLKDYKEFYVDNLQSKNKDFNEDLMSSKNLTREDIQKSEVNPNMTSKILYEMEVSKNMSIQDILQSQKDSKSIER